MHDLDRVATQWSNVPAGVLAGTLLDMLNSDPRLSESASGRQSSYEASFGDQWTFFRRKRWSDIGYTFRNVFALDNTNGEVHLLSPSGNTYLPAPSSMSIGNVATPASMDVFVRGLAEQRQLV